MGAAAYCVWRLYVTRGASGCEVLACGCFSVCETSLQCTALGWHANIRTASLLLADGPLTHKLSERVVPVKQVALVLVLVHFLGVVPEHDSEFRVCALPARRRLSGEWGVALEVGH